MTTQEVKAVRFKRRLEIARIIMVGVTLIGVMMLMVSQNAADQRFKEESAREEERARRSIEKVVDGQVRNREILQKQGVVISCILQLHVEENLPVPADEVEACRKEAAQVQQEALSASVFLQVPTPVPNAAPRSRQEATRGSGGTDNDPSAHKMLDQALGCVGKLRQCVRNTVGQ